MKLSFFRRTSKISSAFVGAAAALLAGSLTRSYAQCPTFQYSPGAGYNFAGTVGAPYSFEIQVLNGQDPVTISLVYDGGLSGYTFDDTQGRTASLNGTAQAPFSGFIAIQVTDGNACTGLATYRVTFAPPPPGTTVANTVEAGNNLCPISTFTGELYEFLPPDISLGGPMPLVFQRYYAAFIHTDGFISGRLGENWLHNFEMNLVITSSNVVDVTTQFGRVVQFTNTLGVFTLIGRLDVPYQLASSAGNYYFGDPVSQRIYTFSSAGLLTQIADGQGNVQTLLYSNNLLTNVSDGLGRSLYFQYNTSGQLTNVSDAVRSIAFTQLGSLLVTAADALGNVTTYTYDGANTVSGLLTATTQPEGNVPFSQVFNPVGQVISQTEAGVLPGTSTLSYATLATTVADPLGNQQKQTHYALGQELTFTDAASNTISMTYNAVGQHSTVTDRLGDKTGLSYHAPSGQFSAITNADGQVITFTYSSRAANGLTFYDVASIIFPDGTTENFSRDSQGNILSRTDQSGKVWSFSYNAQGEVLTGTNPAGGVVTFTYNADGTPASRKDSDTGLTTFLYDQFRRLIKVTHPDATSLSFAYDPDDRLISRSDELGHVFTYTYDGNSNLKQVADPFGLPTQFSYDGRNRVIQTIDRVGAVTGISYDVRGQAMTTTTPTGDLTEYFYDSRRRLTSIVDPDGNSWGHAYDKEDQLVAATNPLDQTHTLQLDTLGFPTNATDALGDQFNNRRDAMKHITLILDPLARSNNFAYDPRGILSSAAHQSLGNALYQRNDLGLLGGITDLNSNHWAFAYTPMGRPQSFTDPLGRVRSYAYDSRGRLQQISFADGTTLAATYDAASNPTGLQYSAGPSLQFAYDSLNRLTTADNLALSYDPDGRVTNTTSSEVNFGAAYDLSGRLTSITYYNNAFTVNYGYDRRGLLTNVTDTLSGVSISFSYDAAGRLTGMSRPNRVNAAYTYDSAGRLTGIQEGTFLNLQYTLDAAGEIGALATTVPLDPAGLAPPPLPALTYDAAHQLASPGWAHDARGRQTASPGHTFAWDGASRLTGIDSVTLGYDGLNQVLTRTQGGVTTRYFYNRAVGLAPIMAERNDTTSQVQRYYVWTPGGNLLYLIDVSNSNAVSFFHFDQVGSTLALTAANGSVSDAYAYTPYGVLLGHTGTSTQPFTYVGEYGVLSEPAVSLYGMRARYYDPLTARFLSPDTVWPRLQHPDALDPYEYALRNPSRYIDPMGLDDATAGAKGKVLVLVDRREEKFLNQQAYFQSSLEELGYSIVSVNAENNRVYDQSGGSREIVDSDYANVQGIIVIGHGGGNSIAGLGSGTILDHLAKTGPVRFIGLWGCHSIDVYDNSAEAFNAHLKPGGAIFGYDTTLFNGPFTYGFNGGFGGFVYTESKSNDIDEPYQDQLMQFVRGEIPGGVYSISDYSGAIGGAIVDAGSAVIDKVGGAIKSIGKFFHLTK
jgi:RHS repeat-associated protein